jgi:PAS domain S-box-containing protein
MKKIKNPIKNYVSNDEGPDKRYRAEEDEAFYRLIFEKSTAPTIVVEKDYIISKINERLENLLGYSKKQMEGKIKWTWLVTKQDLEMMKEYHRLRRVHPDLAPKEYDCHFTGRSGEVFDIRIKMDMIPGTTTSVATLINITEKKKAEKKLVEREAELRAIVDHFPGFVYTSLKNYHIKFVNRILSEKIGKADITGNCHHVFFGFDSPCPWCEHEKVFSGETIRSEFCDPNDNRWYSMVSTPIFGTEGKVLKRQTILIDITDQKRVSEALRTRANQLKKENIRLKITMKERYRFGNIIGKSIKMQKVYELILRAAASDLSVVIYGESGTGKEMVAKEVHRLSKRRKKPFIAINCSAIPDNLMESEFFGYNKGAFTGAESSKKGYLELAESGTLFLDELGAIGQALQVKLLRAIEGGGFIPLGGTKVITPDIKIIAATNQNLLEMISQGKMRDDFFYRIHVIPIYLPPLRKRKSDIPLLIEHFLQSHGNRTELPEIDGAVIETFLKYHWPGNVRELQNVLNRYLTLGTVDFIHDSNFSQPRLVSDPKKLIPEGPMKLKTAMAQVEKVLIKEKLQEKQWHRGKTAKALGINRRTLERRLALYRLNKSETD